MSETVHLLAAVYPDLDQGKFAFNLLQKMHRGATITLVDSALISKNEKGKIKIEETTELTASKGARRGAIILGVIGLIYPPSLIGTVLAGGGIGAIAGRLRDTGIKNQQLNEIADRLENGKSAVIALVDDESTAAVQRALEGCEGELIIRVLDDETVKELYKAAGSGL